MPHILIATDADWVLDEVQAALGGPDVTWTRCRSGKQVVPAVQERTPDLAVLDMQSGNMGAVAVTMALHHEESGERLPHVPVLILLDRRVDLHLAHRSEAESWLVKPLDSLRLRKAARLAMAGGAYQEGYPDGPVVRDPQEASTATPDMTASDDPDDTAGDGPDDATVDGEDLVAAATEQEGRRWRRSSR